MTAAAPVWSPACLDADELADEMRPLGRCNGIPRGDAGDAGDEDVPRRSRPTPIRVPEEDPLTTPAPPAIPCGDCLHAPVCFLKRELPDDLTSYGRQVIGPGLWLVARDYAVECDHYLGAPVPTPADRRLVESPADLEARRRKVAANLTQESRQRGADANRARAAAERATKDARAIALLRQHDGNAEAVGQAMGVTGTAVRGWIDRMSAAGSLPDDVEALIARRARKARAS